MARHGMTKVKTGCITCKIRRVKCDEARPSCNRCVSTGRKCDGYISPPSGSYSWAQLLRVCPPPTQPSSDADLRALSFFRSVVAPVISGPLDSYFWTHLVTQVSEQEQAARHAVLAISSLYEKFKGDPMGRVNNEKNPFAVSNYNEAIRHLRTTNKPETVLVVCILFTCIDMLRGEAQGAIDHCRHGINIMNGSGYVKSNFIRDHLEPAFCRLGIFPFFFGMRPETFPALEAHTKAPEAPFRSLKDAQAALDPLLLRVMRFVRSADEYRLGNDLTLKPDEAKVQDKQDLDAELDSWNAALCSFDSQRPPPGRECQAERDWIVTRLAEMKWLVGKIWIDTCLSRDETMLDLHLDKFQKIIDIGREVDDLLRCSKQNHPRAKFTFDMGFGPLLGFVVIKCRSLRLRAAAIKLMQTISLQREVLWDSSVVMSFGRRMIEIEHELQLRPDENIWDVVDHDGTLPPEDKRIKDLAMQDETKITVGKDGGATVWTRIYFFMREIGGPITVKDEWFSMPLKRKP